jgi:radical SAM/Cys-rich protein
MNRPDKEKPLVSFRETLQRHELRLCRDRTLSLQVNVGLNCGLSCRHCHLAAGPSRGEVMRRETMEGVVAAAKRLRFASVDITGGSPERVPGIGYLVRSLVALTPKLIVRTNLVALEEGAGPELVELYRELGVVLVASLPASNASQTEAQRGSGGWGKSISALQRLNALGYGVDSGLPLHLVANPSGAFLPPPQPQAQKKFREDLRRKHGVAFNELYIFANSPLGRFKDFLERSGNLEDYLARLAAGFNPCTLQGVMCRSQLSVDWEGRLYDCDFNLAVGLRHRGESDSIFSLTELPPPGTPIPVGTHCYACTVGSGFT